MSKALKPEDCRRGHQIIETPYVINMLEREGFYYRPARGGSSHFRYIHGEFPEICVNVIAKTHKRDTQVKAAKAVEQVREMKKQKIKPTRRQLWLRAVVGKIDAAHEEFEIGDNALIITSRDYPCLGIQIPFNITPDAAAQKINYLHRMSENLSFLIDRLCLVYGVTHEVDDENVLHVYQAEWRKARNFAPYDPAQDVDVMAGVMAWEVQLRSDKKVNDEGIALEALAENLRARWPGNEILHSQHHVIIRDAQCPEIGMTVRATESQDDIDAKYLTMKGHAGNFAIQLARLENEYEFTVCRRRRTLYISHQVYEHLAGTVRRFARNGDNDTAFSALDKLETAVIKRDEDFRIDGSLEQTLFRTCKNYKSWEKDGLVHHTGEVRQIGTCMSRTINVISTRKGRMSAAEDGKFGHEFLECQVRDFERVIKGMGYRSKTLEDGTLRMTHAFYENMTFEIPDFAGAKTAIQNLKKLGAAASGPDYVAALHAYNDASTKAFDNFMIVFSQAGLAMIDRFNALHGEFQRLEDVIMKFGYQKTVETVQGQECAIRYLKTNRNDPADPTFLMVPVARVNNWGGKAVYIVMEKTLEVMRQQIETICPGRLVYAKPDNRRPAPVSALPYIAATTQHKIPSPLSAVGLARGYRLQNNIS